MKNIRLIYSTKYSNTIFNNLNLCNCTDSELNLLINIINIVEYNNPGSSKLKIYLVVIYLYYGLVLDENVENYVMINDIKYIILCYYNKDDLIYKDIVKLIFEIASSDKEYCSKIRKLFFNINDQ